jgi:hypothetical protein
VCSGSCTGMTEIAAHDVVAATFGERARVQAEFTAAV